MSSCIPPFARPYWARRDLAVTKVRGWRALSVILPSGRTIAEVAEKSGLKLNTVYVRFLRGWPEKRLGEPLQPKGRRRA